MIEHLNTQDFSEDLLWHGVGLSKPLKYKAGYWYVYGPSSTDPNLYVSDYAGHTQFDNILAGIGQIYGAYNPLAFCPTTGLAYYVKTTTCKIVEIKTGIITTNTVPTFGDKDLFCDNSGNIIRIDMYGAMQILNKNTNVVLDVASTGKDYTNIQNYYNLFAYCDSKKLIAMNASSGTKINIYKFPSMTLLSNTIDRIGSSDNLIFTKDGNLIGVMGNTLKKAIIDATTGQLINLITTTMPYGVYSSSYPRFQEIKDKVYVMTQTGATSAKMMIFDSNLNFIRSFDVETDIQDFTDKYVYTSSSRQYKIRDTNGNLLQTLTPTFKDLSVEPIIGSNLGKYSTFWRCY